MNLSFLNSCLFLTTVICLLFQPISLGTGQENQEANATAKKQEKMTGFAWLKQFEGTWSMSSHEPTEDGAEPTNVSSAIMTSRTVGDLWVINEQNGQFGTTRFHAVQSIGYDSTTKQYTGSWIDSLSTYAWSYTGSLSDDGKSLILAAEGPDWTDPSKMREYRDVYQMKSENEFVVLSQMKNDEGEWEVFMEGSMVKTNATQTITPFLMFEGKANAAIEFYKTVFENVEVENLNKYKAGEAGKEGTVEVATLVIEDQRVKCIDSPVDHDFDFTPSFSFFVECESEAQLKERFSKLAEGGSVMMPIDNYGFSKQFAWVSDQFGVSWQLNLSE